MEAEPADHPSPKRDLGNRKKKHPTVSLFDAEKAGKLLEGIVLAQYVQETSETSNGTASVAENNGRYSAWS